MEKKVFAPGNGGGLVAPPPCPLSLRPSKIWHLQLSEYHTDTFKENSITVLHLDKTKP